MPLFNRATASFPKLALLFFLFWQANSYGQTIISGQINAFDTLVSYNSSPCGDELVSAGLVNFNAGDLVLIYNRLEAICNLSNSSSFGSLQNLNGSGHYQLVRLQQVTGNVITLNTSLKHNFSSGSQLVKVPEYQSARVNTNINAASYINSMGGILCLKADKLIIAGAVEADASGFSGGYSTANMGYACGAADYFYPALNFDGAPKGKGIVPLGSAFPNGRGKACNAGGGGNNHNAGGGGGANGGNGGKGGNEWGTCSPVAAVGGLGGEALVLDTNRFYFGGGGGSGHNNLSNTSSEGGAGGGLILIFADTIEVISGSISAQGLSGKSMSNGAEGSGGGGAGGSIVLQFSKLIGNLNLNAAGGNGGSSTGGFAGPGGGGGGGSIFLPPNSAVDYSAGSVNLIYNGGTAGHLSNASNNYGSLPGQSGSVNRTLAIPALTVTQGNLMPRNILGNDTSICGSDSLLLVASMAGIKSWSTGESGDSIYISNAGAYWVEINQGGCNFGDSILVNLIMAQPFSLGADTTICGDSFRLSAPLSGAWLWSFGNAQDSTIAISQTGWYWLRIGVASCNYRDSIYVEFLSNPNFSLPAEVILCTGDSISLSAPTGLNFSWNDGFLKRQRWISTAGIYWLEVSASNGCTLRDSTLIIITNDADSINLFLPNDSSYCEEKGITFDFSGYGLDLVWQDGGNANVRRFSGSQIIWAEYDSRCGTKRDSIFIEGLKCDTCLINFPNAFTPNGDGLNEYFLLQSACNFEQYHLEIYSRWGELMFESNDQYLGWDGTFKDEKAIQGSYVYQLYYGLPFKGSKVTQGIVHLLY